ncbi:MAG TPA: ATP-binding cassette domain-containing protein [Longimicrobiales bacterium]|nr:ATP-binding cassette domain-containing protein [Longimicrobiales bacterium]
MTHALELEHVSKSYAEHVAVRDLSLSVPTGSVYGILGPNGAGKSTTLRMIMNILLRDSGQIRLLGRDPERDREVLERVGYLPEERGLYRKMKVMDVIVFFARLKGVDAADARSRGSEWLEKMGLADWGGAKVETLSKGMQQKVQFITTVLHEPEVLILDEPQSGLDPVNQEVLRETILSTSRAGRTVILSTHNMAEAQRMCDAVCIIAEGAKVLDGSVRAIRREHRANRFALEFDEDSEGVRRFMRESPHVLEARESGGGWEVALAGESGAGPLLGDLARLDVPVSRFEHLQPTLHEIFVSRVGDASRARRVQANTAEASRA